MPRRGRALRDMLASGTIPLERLMLETDAPFMHPQSEDPEYRKAKRRAAYGAFAGGSE
eukprot:m.244829 g.244829  ORF g.244829 m.244829 type:complete len:58 (-) comp19477_c0_seq10:684-857(-)